MLSKNDLDAAIAECLAVPNPTKNTCLYLAAFQTVKDCFFSDKQGEIEQPKTMSFSPGAQLHYDSDSEFGRAYNTAPLETLAVVDELIDTLSITNPALYRNVDRKLRNI